MSRPKKSEYDPFYENYVSLVSGDDIASFLDGQPAELREMIAPLPEERGSFAYESGKWTIKELLSHVIDGERIFAYRLLRISRGDRTPIEGFDQEIYIENSHANERSFDDLLAEFEELRSANLRQIRNLRSEDLARTGTANNVEISARAIAFVMGGHVVHHFRVLRERYLG